MKVKVKGSSVTLGKKEFIAKGGEGSVYVKGSHAYKIYENSAKMISADKMAELGAITDTRVIKPEHPILDAHGTPIGYTMAYVQDTHALCQIFTQAFRTRHGITDQAVLDLIQGMRNTVQHIHEASILVVDMNELNFLVDGAFEKVFFIDVDSYQTPHFKATALMASVQDYKTPIGKFTTESDWFSWGCVSFQMLMGLHPYKGKYTPVKGLEKRMRADISVFHPDVRLPKVCPSFDLIPQHLRDWYKAVFQDGKRLAPPIDIEKAGVVPVTSMEIISSGNLDIEEVLRVDGKILSVSTHEDRMVVRTAKHLYYYEGSRLAKHWNVNKGEVAIYWHHGSPHAFKASRGQCKVMDLSTGTLSDIVPAVDQLMEYDGRVYFKSGDKVLEVQMRGTMVGTHVVANVVPNASKLYPGCCIQNMLGSVFVNIFTASKVGDQIRLADLDGYRILDAKFDGRTLLVVGEQGGKYHKLTYTFMPHYDVRVRVQELSSACSLNFVRLGTGVCVCLNEDDELEIWSYDKDPKKVQDDALSSDMQLFKKPGQLMFFRGETIHSVKMR